MLSLHTQVENLANLLHARRAERVQRLSQHDAYRNLLAAIFEVPVSSIRETPAYQPAFAGSVAALPARPSRAA